MVSNKTNKNVIIFGADGLLGKEIASCLSGSTSQRVHAFSKKYVDITDRKSVMEVLSKVKPHIVVNCAVVVDVDYCELNPLTAWNVNAIGAGIIADSIIKSNLKGTSLVQISSSDVFGDSKKTHSVSDIPSPVNVYGWSKYGGEKIIEQIGSTSLLHYFIIRAGWLYGAGHDTYVDLIVNSLHNNKPISAFTDQFNIPVWTKDIAKIVLTLTRTQKKYPSGMYHVSDSTIKKGVSKFDIATHVAQILNYDTSMIKKSLSTDTHRARRPKNAVLAHSSTLEAVDWKKSLKEYLLSRYTHR